MKMEELEAFGFQVCGGQIDYAGVNAGTLTLDGPVLNEYGEEVARSHAVRAAAKKPRKAKADTADAADAAAEPADE